MAIETISESEFKHRWRYALDRFNWAQSFLDADAIKFLNEWEIHFDRLVGNL